LKTLVKGKFVHEEGRKNWKRGKKLRYSLTKKGMTECIHEAVNGLNEVLMVIQEIGEQIFAEPSIIEEFREKGRQAVLEIKITESMSIGERVDAVRADMKRTYGPLNEAYKVMHKLMIQLMAPKIVRDNEFFIGFKGEGIQMIPRIELERRGLIS
jgi:hypothetical protein